MQRKKKVKKCKAKKNRKCKTKKNKKNKNKKIFVIFINPPYREAKLPLQGALPTGRLNCPYREPKKFFIASLYRDTIYNEKKN